MQLLRRTARYLARRVGLARPGSAPSGGREVDAAWYDSLYTATEDYHRPYQEVFYYFLWSVIVDRVRRAGSRRVLEIGCGPGQLAAYLLDQGVEEFVGLDFSPRAIDMARRNAPAGRFLVGDARSSGIYTESEYDLIICTEVLEHIEDDLAVVSKFRPGVRCLCSVPNFPYESHVRFFQDDNEVRARYGSFFHSLDVMTFPSPRAREDHFYLLDGVRNAHVHSLDGRGKP
jgi:SAM-dependent methyltransferase